MSRGLVYLAAKTGNAIIPTSFSCDRAWEIKGSWTSLTVPKPFSHVQLLVGRPIRVPADAPEWQLDEYVQQVQESMDGLQARANPHHQHSGQSRGAGWGRAA